MWVVAIIVSYFKFCLTIQFVYGIVACLSIVESVCARYDI
jgi:hypothetical protein